MKLALLVLLVWNALAFCLFGWDKWCAVRHRRRVPERNLLGVAFLAGAVGAWIGARTFRHKTSKPSFYWPLRIALGVNLLLYGAAVYSWLERRGG